MQPKPPYYSNCSREVFLSDEEKSQSARVVRKKSSREHWCWAKESNDRKVQGIAQSQDFQGDRAEC